MIFVFDWPVFEQYGNFRKIIVIGFKYYIKKNFVRSVWIV